MNIANLLDRIDPSRYVSFQNRSHDRRNAGVLGAALGVCFFICFFTGLVSHFMQHPPSWFAWPSRPVGFYRVTQGLHVASGLFAIPLLLAKLWVVYPKLFEWPPVNSVAQFFERVSLLPLIGGGLFMVITGVANINQWYFFHFFFTDAHYAVAWITIGALIVHIGAKWAIVRQELFSPAHPTQSELESESGAATPAGVYSRRAFLVGVFGTSGIITLFTVGQSFSPLGGLALLSPRRPGVGPQHLPVNKTASGAGVIASAQSVGYALTVEGRTAKPFSLSLDELRALPQHSAVLPISCVEGWSASAHWRGVRVRDLVAMAGVSRSVSVRVESLEQHGAYGQSILNRHHVADADTLLALELNGEPLQLDHGYPCRLIGPNRPGVLQTKWVNRLVVL